MDAQEEEMYQQQQQYMQM